MNALSSMADGFFTITFNRPVLETKGEMSLKNVPKDKRKEIILKKIKDQEPFTLGTLADEIGVNRKTVNRDIEELKQDGKIKFIGPKRSGHYELKR